MPLLRSTTTIRFSTEWSALTTNAYWPCWPTWIAAVGTTIEVGSSVSATVTLTNCPGHSRRSVLGNVPLIRMVPVD